MQPALSQVEAVMKRTLLFIGTVFFALSLTALGQNQGGPGPHAWGDKNKDGKCDVTGQPVGQGRGQGMRAMGRAGGGCGRNQQNGCCQRGKGSAAQATPAPEQKK
jgi:hypothetical protein